MPEGVCLVEFLLSTIAYFVTTVYIDNVQAKKFLPHEPYFYCVQVTAASSLITY